MLNNKWSSLCSLCLYFQHIPIRFVIFPNLEFSRSNFSPSRWWTLCRAALIIDIFIMLLSCTGWFSFLLKCRINLEISSDILPKSKSRKCLKVFWSFQYRPWLKITPNWEKLHTATIYYFLLLKNEFWTFSEQKNRKMMHLNFRAKILLSKRSKKEENDAFEFSRRKSCLPQCVMTCMRM